MASPTQLHSIRHRGFTLSELMVVVGLVAILSTLAAPSFRTFIGTMNAKSAAFDLIGDLTMARSESLKRRRNVSIVPVSGDWVNGWEIRDDAAAEPVLRSRGALKSSLSISGAPGTGIVFAPHGRIQDTDSDTGNATWSVSSSISGVQGRCVVITPSGAARSKTGACS